jgi:hypothetical protein
MLIDPVGDVGQNGTRLGIGFHPGVDEVRFQVFIPQDRV